jgi:hypothetical protein
MVVNLLTKPYPYGQPQEIQYRVFLTTQISRGRLNNLMAFSRPTSFF